MTHRIDRASAFVVCSFLALVLHEPNAGAADAVPAGGEFQVNTYTTGDQGGHRGYLNAGLAVAASPSGDFVVAWQDYDGLDGEFAGIFARRFSSNGQALADQFQVNTYTTDAQRYPRVATDDRGNFVVVWESGGYHDGDGFGVFGRRYDDSGAALADEFQVNTYTTGLQWRPDVCALSDNGFAVVWESSAPAFDVFARTFDSNGQPISGEFLVNQYTTDFQVGPAVSCDGAGRFVVVWASQGQLGSSYGFDVFGRRFAASGAALSSEFLVNSYTSGSQTEPAVAVAESGEFLVAWSDANSPARDGSESGIFARRFDNSAAPVGTDFAVNTYTTGGQYIPRASADSDGGFVVAWTSTPEYGSSASADGNEQGCSARRFGAVGTQPGEEFQVNSYTTGHQQGATPTADAAGGIVIAWTSGPKTTPSQGQDGDGFGVFAQRYTLETTPVDPCGNPIDPGTPNVNVTDALAVLRAAVGLFTCELCVCDVNGSGTLQPTDALTVLRRVVGLDATFNCPPCA